MKAEGFNPILGTLTLSPSFIHPGNPSPSLPAGGPPPRRIFLILNIFWFKGRYSEFWATISSMRRIKGGTLIKNNKMRRSNGLSVG